uniref:ANF_receptor domain-containing protein n=1 Tax=Macrostomum lignano TaxID=282301 RepID=A0A1I8IW40_9PLAT
MLGTACAPYFFLLLDFKADGPGRPGPPVAPCRTANSTSCRSFTLFTSSPCSPVHPVHQFTLFTSSPCSPVHPVHQFTLFTSSHPVHQFTLFTSSPCSPVHHVHQFTPFTSSPCSPVHPVHQFTLFTSSHLFTSSPCSPVHHVHQFTLFTSSPVHQFTLFTSSPCSPVHPVHQFTLFTSSPCSPVHPVHQFTLFTSSPCSPVHPVHQFTLFTSSICNSDLNCVTDLKMHDCRLPVLPLLFLAVAILTPRAIGRDLTISVFLPALRHRVPGMSLEAARPAVDVALETASSMGLLTGLRVRVVANDSQCDYKVAPVVGLLLLREVDVMLGPFCSFSLAAVARYNGYHLYQKPIISSGGAASALDSKTEYFNLVRVGAISQNLENMLLSIFRYYKWPPRPVQSLLLVHVPDEVNTQPDYNTQELMAAQGRLMCNAIEKRFSHQNNYIVRKLPYAPNNTHFHREVFRVMRDEVRIVVLCADPDTVRDIMIKAYEHGFINGEYVFFNIDLFSSEQLTARPWHRSSDTDSNNQAAAIAYRTLLTVTLRRAAGDRYAEFSRRVRERAKADYGLADYPDGQVNSFVGAIHDAVLLYALAVNDTLAEFGPAGLSNGTLVTERMRNRTFAGITGLVSMNDNADRDADYSLLDMDPATLNFTVVANYHGGEKRYVPVKDKRIDWYNRNNRPPPDVPECGFRNSKCS